MFLNKTVNPTRLPFNAVDFGSMLHPSYYLKPVAYIYKTKPHDVTIDGGNINVANYLFFYALEDGKLMLKGFVTLRHSSKPSAPVLRGAGRAQLLRTVLVALG